MLQVTGVCDYRMSECGVDRRWGSMSNQAHKEPKEDAAKKRREYLRLKTETKSLGFFGTTVAAASVLTTATLIYIGFRILRYTGELAAFWSCLLCLLLTLSAGVLGIWLWRLASLRADTLVYVPPVREQLAALPADEVLLRGSDLPAARPDELLRAAQAGMETAPQVLLRAQQTEIEAD